MPENDIDFVKMLDEELQSCCLPSIKDTSKANTDDIIRDMYKVLTGNGNVTKGLVVKVAATNVHVKLLRQNIKSVDDKVDAQVARCTVIQSEKEKNAAVFNAEINMWKKIGKVLWDNRTIIVLLVVSVIIMFKDSFIAKVDVKTMKDLIKQEVISTFKSNQASNVNR